MDVRQLRYFIHIVELGGFTRAAESLNVAQPALSQQIAKLEAALGTRLLIRTRKGAVPTESGRTLYGHAHRILRQLDQARSDIRAQSKSPSGHVSVALPGSAAQIIAVPLLQAVRERFPEVLLEITEGTNRLLTEMLVNGRTDIAVLYRDTALSGMSVCPLLREELFLAVASAPPFQMPSEATIRFTDLADIPLILPGRDTPKRVLIETSLSAHGLSLNLAAETTALTTTIAAVAAGIGAAILPWAAVCDHLERLQLRLIPIRTPILLRPIGVCTSALITVPTAASSVRDTLRDVIARSVRDGAWQHVEPWQP